MQDLIATFSNFVAMNMTNSHVACTFSSQFRSPCQTHWKQPTYLAQRVLISAKMGCQILRRKTTAIGCASDLPETNHMAVLEHNNKSNVMRWWMAAPQNLYVPPWEPVTSGGWWMFWAKVLVQAQPPVVQISSSHQSQQTQISAAGAEGCEHHI